MKKIIVAFLVFLLVGCGQTISLSVEDLTLQVGEEKQLITKLENSTKKLIYDVADDTIISASENGTVKGLKEGETTIKVTVDETNISKEVTIKVIKKTVVEPEPEPDEITLSILGPSVLKTGETSKIVVETNDEKSVSFKSSDDSVLTVDAAGNIAGIKEGKVSVTVTSATDDTVQEVLTITVYDEAIKHLDESIALNVNQTQPLVYESIFDIVYTSSDETIFNVENNTIKGLKAGDANLVITIPELPDFQEEVAVSVFPMPTRITLSSQNELVIQETALIEVAFEPEGSIAPLAYQSNNEAIAMVNEQGEVTAVAVGTAYITVVSKLDSRLKANIKITVVDKVVVKANLTEGESVKASGHTFKAGINAFETIAEAVAKNPSEIILLGEHTTPIAINDSMVLSGTETTRIKDVLTINTSAVTIQGFTFVDNGKIEVSAGLKNVVLKHNTFKELTHTEAAIGAVEQESLEVSYNTLDLNNTVGILVDNPTDKKIIVKGNIINGASTAIEVTATKAYEQTLSVQIAWNKIDLSHTSVVVDLSYEPVFTHDISYVRFNEITNYTFGAVANTINLIDFNLNYWGEVPNYEKFTNLGQEDLDGYYLDKKDILLEAHYDPRGPSFVKILNDLDEVNINENIQIEIKTLPREISPETALLLTGDSKLMSVNENHTLKLLRSGFVDLILKSRFNDNVIHRVTFEIITDPGIEIIPENVNNQLTIGNTLQFNTMVFPRRIEDSPVTFSVDDDTIASISATGLLTANKAGLVTVKAELHNNPEVYQQFVLEIYDALNDDDIFDFISSSMITYTTLRGFLTYGFTNVWYDGFESVSRIIFESMPRNRSMMIPDCDTLTGQQRENCLLLRPGSRPTMLEGLETYNNDRVHYVTVHETANTNIGQGAYSHAVYLLNQVKGTTTLRQASWHFTMDDKELYQHIETKEMAWHAGDGSRKAGTTWGSGYLGGGNAHSIGIEMSVARTDDILRIWQRTAKLSAQLAREYNLPEKNVKFHQDFSGKWCPQSMLRAELTWLFYEMVKFEYKLENTFNGAVISFTSNNPEYVDNAGRVIKMPDRAQNVSFTVTITYQGETKTKTYYSYLPGTVH